MRKAALVLSVGAALAAASPAAAVTPKTGQNVYGPGGEQVGTIQSVSGDAAVVWTGTTKVTLGLGSFRTRGDGVGVSMGKAELERAAAAVQAQGDAAARAQLTPGASVYGPDGVAAATVDSVESDQVILAVGRVKVRLPISAFSKGKPGARIGMTKAQLEASAAKQAPRSNGYSDHPSGA